MGDSESNSSSSKYLRAGLVIRKHPNRPLDGHKVTVSTSADIELVEIDLRDTVAEATSRFDIEEYRTGLCLGTVYFEPDGVTPIGVKWETEPRVYEHGEFTDPVSTLPENIEDIE